MKTPSIYSLGTSDHFSLKHSSINKMESIPWSSGTILYDTNIYIANKKGHDTQVHISVSKKNFFFPLSISLSSYPRHQQKLTDADRILSLYRSSVPLQKAQLGHCRQRGGNKRFKSFYIIMMTLGAGLKCHLAACLASSLLKVVRWGWGDMCYQTMFSWACSHSGLSEYGRTHHLGLPYNSEVWQGEGMCAAKQQLNTACNYVLAISKWTH